LKLFSYVVEHDNGFAPNPFGGYCTLAWCKYANPKSNKRNLVEMAAYYKNDLKEDVWILGTGGCSHESAGNGKIIYVMRVTKALELDKYDKDKTFKSKKYIKGINECGDWRFNIDYKRNEHKIERFVLVSNDFYYFGKDAEEIRNDFKIGGIEKKFWGYKCNFKSDLVSDFIDWVREEFKNKKGQFGLPCNPKKTIRKTRTKC
jgi:hypothetical protein